MGAITSNLFIFTALECEAKPLISFYKLKKKLSLAFLIYSNDTIILTVTGVGKNSMAAGVAYTLATFPPSLFPILINIGIAGHATLPIGSLCVTNKVVDVDSEKKYYPQLLGNGWPNSYSLKTHSKPCLDYSDNCLHDMEASAFYEIAVKFSSCELIQCIKIISDNQLSCIDNINAKKVISWIETPINKIDKILIRLSDLHQSIAANELPRYTDILKLYHFTVTGKIKLKSLLLRWKLLTNTDWFPSETNNYSCSKQLLKQLEADINKKDLYL